MFATNSSPVSVLWFGTGNMTQSLLSAIDDTKMQILAFIDEREEMRNTSFSSLPVIGLDQIHDYAFEYILVGTRSFEAIKEKLIRAGVPHDKIHSLDFEQHIWAFALPGILLRFLWKNILNLNPPVYGMFREQDLFQTKWLKRVIGDPLCVARFPDSYILCRNNNRLQELFERYIKGNIINNSGDFFSLLFFCT